MKILHVLSSSSFSGAENVACQIVKMFDESDYNMAYTSPMGPINNALKDRNIKYVPMRSFTKKELKKVILQFKPDIIHAHDRKASFLTSITCGKTPFISHIHNNFKANLFSLKTFGFIFPAFKAKHIIWVSNTSFSSYKLHNLFKRKSTTLYNVIDINNLQNKATTANCNEHFDLIYLGRLSYQKNPLRLIEILKLVLQLNPEIKIAIVGKGELEDEVKQKVIDYNLSNNIIFKGYLENPYGLLRNSKLMIMCSFYEGTPMCALESMALGTPLITTQVDGLNEIIDNGVNGIFALTNDEFANSILNILSNKEYLEKLSNNAFQKSKIINDTINYKNKLSAIYSNIL